MNTYRQIVKYIDKGMNDEDIAGVVKVTPYVVGRVRVQLRLERDKRTPIKIPVSQRKSVTATFPDLEPMTDQQRIVALTLHGMAAPKIKKHLRSPLISERVINRYARRKLGPRRVGINNSRDNFLSFEDISIITQILEDKFGKNRYECEICLEPVDKGCSLHHTKYEGATIYDMMFVCQSCNLARENVGLA